jgi:acetyl-CoA carboxylase biotin carboxyl carrier protein
MDLNYLRRLVKIFDDSKATHMDIEEDGVRISLAFETTTIQQVATAAPVVMPVQAPIQVAQENPEPAGKVTEPNATQHIAINLHTINSPIVGTLYRSPSPDAGSFVELGSRVKPGDTLCIIEAMKLMNEIESDTAGIIEQILVDNGKPVEFNQPIFVIRPD